MGNSVLFGVGRSYRVTVLQDDGSRDDTYQRYCCCDERCAARGASSSRLLHLWRRHHGLKGPQPAGVPGTGRKRHVDRGPLGLRSAGLGCRPGAGERGVRVRHTGSAELAVVLFDDRPAPELQWSRAAPAAGPSVELQPDHRGGNAPDQPSVSRWWLQQHQYLYVSAASESISKVAVRHLRQLAKTL